MSAPGPPRGANSRWGRMGLVAGAVAVVLPLPMFGIKVPTLPALQQNTLLALFIVSLACCSWVGSSRPLLGLLVLPSCFFGIACLACWWVVRVG